MIRSSRALRLLQPPRLGAHLAQRNAGRVIDENRSVRQLLHRPHHFLRVVLPQRTGAHLVRIHSRLRTQQAHQQRFARHFQREHAHHLLIFDRGVLRNVHDERGLAHGRPRRNDHQIGTLQARRHLIEIGIVRRQSRDALAALQQRIDRAERFADDLLNAHEPAPNALLRKLEDRRLGVAENVFRRVRLVRWPAQSPCSLPKSARAAAPCRAQS